MTVIAYEFLVDKVAKGLQWITRPLEKLKDKITESIHCYLKPKTDNLIIIIEAVLEVIWRVVNLFCKLDNGCMSLRLLLLNRRR